MLYCKSLITNAILTIQAINVMQLTVLLFNKQTILDKTFGIQLILFTWKTLNAIPLHHLKATTVG